MGLLPGQEDSRTLQRYGIDPARDLEYRSGQDGGGGTEAHGGPRQIRGRRGENPRRSPCQGGRVPGRGNSCAAVRHRRGFAGTRFGAVLPVFSGPQESVPCFRRDRRHFGHRDGHLGRVALRRVPAFWCVWALAAMIAAASWGATAGAADTAAAASASPRVEARSADLLIVGLAHADRMTIHVSRLLDNAPVRDAQVLVVLRGAAHPTTAETDGSYTLQTK